MQVCLSAYADGVSRKNYSPDKKSLVSINDIQLDPNPGDEKRIITVFSTSDSTSLAGFASCPRSTEVYWNPKSTMCVVVDAPDNGNINLYLFTVKSGLWSIRAVNNPFDSIEKKFYAQNKNPATLWRAAIDKVEWTTASTLRISIEDGLGVHLVNVKCN